jgi:hypothetical protein
MILRLTSEKNQSNCREEDVNRPQYIGANLKIIRARKSIVAGPIASTKTIQDKRDEWRNESIVGER